MSARPVFLPEDDEAGPPRHNGELVFEAPWEGRVFGLAVALAERGCFEWRQFQALLVEETALADAAIRAGQEAPTYYVRWARALERLLDRVSVLDPSEVEATAARVTAEDPHRPH